jgi:hypothetical protein
LFKKIPGPKLGKLENYWKITTCDKPQKEKPNRKKNQTNKQTNIPRHIHTCVWRKNLRELFFGG